MTNDEKWERYNGAHTLEDYIDFHAVNERFTGENDHPSTQEEVDEAMLLDQVRETLVKAIRLQACKDWAEIDECEECRHAIHLHADKYGCQHEGGDRWVNGESMGGWVATGPCGCKAYEFAAAEEGQHKNGTGEQGTARPSGSPLTACEWLRDEGVLP